jgi:hypothetical protein
MSAAIRGFLMGLKTVIEGIAEASVELGLHSD